MKPIIKLNQQMKSKVKSTNNGKKVANLYGKQPTEEQAAAIHFLLNESNLKHDVKDIRAHFEGEFITSYNELDMDPIFLPAIRLCQFYDELKRIAKGGPFR
jgi:hypothetical protein